MYNIVDKVSRQVIASHSTIALAELNLNPDTQEIVELDLSSGRIYEKTITEDGDEVITPSTTSKLPSRLDLLEKRIEQLENAQNS